MSHQSEYYYNEHDENQVHKLWKSKKKRKLKRRFKILMILVIFVLVGAYFVSDYSKIQSITIVGTHDVKKEDVLKTITINENSFHLFVNTKKVAQEVKDMPLIKKANVSKDLLGHVKIEIEEAEKIAYCVIDKKTYIIDELGDVLETDDQQMIASLHACPQLTQFKDVKFLKTFAKEYVKIPELVKNQTSDIVYSPLDSDPTRLKFIMDNGKLLYLRVEDMVKQLELFDYEAFMTAYSQYCEFSFEGKNVYMKKCR